MKKISILFAFSFVVLVAGLAVNAQTVAGDWAGSLNTPGGEVPLKLTLVVDGEKLSGTVHRQAGDTPLAGTIKGSDIVFAYTINYSGNDLTLTYTGKVTGDTMSGSVDFAGQASDSWSAKRVTPEKPKE
jgi:hypothetical protein